MSTSALFTYTLHLADNALILAQRNAEWTGHGPVLEQDIALTNIALDLLGQARNFYQHAAELYNGFNESEKEAVAPLLPALWKTFNRNLTEDDLAFLRDEPQYRNLLLTELPNGDWAQTVLKQALFSLFQQQQYHQLQQSNYTPLAAIAAKAAKETAYHVRWSSEWVIRLGDGTEESNRRINAALHWVWPFTGEFFAAAPFEQAAAQGFGMDMAVLKSTWLQKAAAVFAEATLALPLLPQAAQGGGKWGRHTQHFCLLLTEMQHLQRTHPNAVW